MTTEATNRAHMAMAMLHGAERQHAEEQLREALETLATCTTHGGDLWYDEGELRSHVQEQVNEVYDSEGD